MLSIGNTTYGPQFTFAPDGTVSLTTTPLPIGGGTITGPVVIKTNTAPTLPAPTAGTLLQLGAADGVNTRIVIDAFGVAVPVLNFRRANTSAAAPSAIQSGDTLAIIAMQGYGASGYSAAARASITSFAAQNWSDTVQSTYMTFGVTPQGTATPIEAVRIADSGNVGIGTASPDLKLTVSTNAAPLPAANGVVHIGAADGLTARLYIDSFGANPSIAFRLARNTAAAPLNVVNGSCLGALNFFGYGTTGYSSSSRGQIGVFANQDWTDSAQGTFCAFYTVPNGSITQTEAMRIDHNGNVGIGTTGPGAKLGIVANAATPLAMTADTYFYAQMNGNQANSQFGWQFTPRDAAGTIIPSGYLMLIGGATPSMWMMAPGNANGDLLFGSNNGSGGILEAMRVRFNGNVGIGTTLPGSKLEVNGQVSAAGGYISSAFYPLSAISTAPYGPQVALTNNVADATGGYIIFSKGRAGGTTALMNDCLGTLAWYGADTTNTKVPGGWIQMLASSAPISGSVPSYMAFFTTSAASGTQEKMRITDTGIVAIGTLSPSAAFKLHVAGAIGTSYQGNLFGSAGGNMSTPTAANTNISLYQVSGSNWAGIGSDVAGNMYFVTGTSAPASRLVIGAAVGNVGIGTTVPAQTAKLHVLKLGSGFPVNTGTTQSAGHILRLDDNTGAILDIGGSGGAGFWLSCTNGSNLSSAYPLFLNSHVAGAQVAIGTGVAYHTLTVGGAICIANTQGFSLNAYFSGAWNYATSAPAAAMSVGGAGALFFYVGPSGTAGAAIATFGSPVGIWYNGSLSVGTGYSASMGPANGLTVQGNVGIGAGSPNAKLHIVGASVTGGISEIVSGGPNSLDTTTTLLQFADAAYISTLGTIMRTSGGVAYNTTSDRALKRNIVDSDIGLEILMKIKVRDYNHAYAPDHTEQGVIAQELHEIYPIVVYVGDETNPRNPWMIDYGRLTPLLIKGMQQQQAMIEQQQDRIQKLEDMVMKGTA